MLTKYLRMKSRAIGENLHVQPSSWSEWIDAEGFRRSFSECPRLTYRTYSVAFCCLVQLQMLYDIPTPLATSDLEFLLPCSEEEWCAENEEKWKILMASDDSAPTPSFQEAFGKLFSGKTPCTKWYSEFGGYVMISGVLYAILDAYRISRVPTATVEFSTLDTALDTWQKVWEADPRSHVSGSVFGTLAFNAAVVYRAASVRRIRDYSKYCLLCFAKC
jgi:hypothetical protein